MRNTHVGLTGWLTPEGKFIKCVYGNHYMAANRLMARDSELRTRQLLKGEKYTDSALREFQYVPMGSKGEGYDNISHIAPPTAGGFTVKQIKWLLKNYHKLDETQQSLLDIYGKNAGWKPENVVRKDII